MGEMVEPAAVVGVAGGPHLVALGVKSVPNIETGQEPEGDALLI